MLAQGEKWGHARSDPGTPGILLFQELQHFRGMCLRVANRNPMFLDRAIGSDQSCGADRPLDRLTLSVLARPPGTVRLHHADLRIGQ